MTPTEFEDIIAQAGEHFTLSADERSSMRSALREYTASKPLGVVSPFMAYIRRPVVWSTSFALAFILVSTGGIALAAEGTLPGDALYPVKVGVTEPLRAALTVSTKAKVALHQTFAERRLNEAVILLKHNALSTTTEATIVANFDYNASLALATTTASSTPPEQKDSGSIHFAARLATYEHEIDHIAHDEKTATTTPLHGAIRAQIEKLTHEHKIKGEPVPPKAGRVLELP